MREADRQRERGGGERERERDRQTDRQTQRTADGQKQRERLSWQINQNYYSPSTTVSKDITYQKYRILSNDLLKRLRVYSISFVTELAQPTHIFFFSDNSRDDTETAIVSSERRHVIIMPYVIPFPLSFFRSYSQRSFSVALRPQRP